MLVMMLVDTAGGFVCVKTFVPVLVLTDSPDSGPLVLTTAMDTGGGFVCGKTFVPVLVLTDSPDSGSFVLTTAMDTGGGFVCVKTFVPVLVLTDSPDSGPLVLTTATGSPAGEMVKVPSALVTTARPEMIGWVFVSELVVNLFRRIGGAPCPKPAKPKPKRHKKNTSFFILRLPINIPKFHGQT